MKLPHNCLFVLSIFLMSFLTKGISAQDYTTFVNPFIGTGGHGHTYPGASVPFGMVQLSPDTRLDGWDGCSAYHASDSIIYGFSHTHLSGTGCSDYGDILLMPVTGDISLVDYSYSSPFKHSSEAASPGYYKVALDHGNIKVELTATERAGLHQYTFSQQGDVHIVLDLKHRDKVLESSLHIAGNDEIEGMRISQAWAAKQIIYFVVKFSKPFHSHMIKAGNEHSSTMKDYSGENILAYFSFLVNNGEKILVKVGISAVSAEGARKNMEKEMPGWDFEKFKKEAAESWNKELGKIEADGGTTDQKTVFYSALYHALLSPNLYMDVDGNYRGRDLKIHNAAGFDYYTVFSLWDTYRATHPLFTIIEQERTSDFINTFIRQYEEGGMLPAWELSGNETGCMIGYHAVPVIVDAYMKGILGYDVGKAYEAMKHSAEQDHLGLKYYKSLGFIPGDMESESVSKTLEYAYDDWCIAQMARSLGKEDDYRNYIHRAQYYKNLFDPATGFMRAKMNNTWFSPFDPAEVNFNYTEANAWQYSFYVPQDLDGLIKLHGGKEQFIKKLDAMFKANSETTGRNQSDISGLIGQYAHGNEPSHHMAYLYDYAGQPWKTQELVHKICFELYSSSRDGLCGNEDCGQMSSWYVLSAMGFYPVTPGSGIYAMGTPLFPRITLRLENGKQFVIRADDVNKGNFYVQSAKLNGIPHAASFISHQEIMKGGELIFSMGSRPDKSWGSGEGDIPVSAITHDLITPVPSIDNGKKAFVDSTLVTLVSPLPGTTICYTLDNSEPSLQSTVYKNPLIIKRNTVLKAFAFQTGLPESFVISAEFKKMPGNRKIILNTKYAGQYSAGGEMALIDFIRGGTNFKTGTWQGYEGENLDAIVDLGTERSINKISAGFLQDQGSWIFMPVKVIFSLSVDGKTYNEIGSVTNDVPDNNPDARIKEFTLFLKDQRARFIKVVGKNRGTCPAWHPGAGQKAWIFTDEITID